MGANKSIDDTIAELQELSNPTFLNRFRTMVCLINESDISAGEYKGTQYWKSLPEQCRKIVNH